MIKAVKLQDLRNGDQACIESMMGSDQEISRLAALGIQGGARLQLLRRGSPCIIQLEDSRICLRTGKQLQILVRPE